MIVGPIKTWSRRSMVIPDMVGLTTPCTTAGCTCRVLVSENMVGHKLGEFRSDAHLQGAFRRQESHGAE